MAEGMTCYEQDEALCEDQMCLRDGPKWIKHWQFKFLSGIYRAQHEHDVEQARRYAELRDRRQADYVLAHVLPQAASKAAPCIHGFAQGRCPICPDAHRAQGS